VLSWVSGMIWRSFLVFARDAKVGVERIKEIRSQNTIFLIMGIWDRKIN
jgi:hypothetical protein